jgi:hypothetical protein
MPRYGTRRSTPRITIRANYLDPDYEHSHVPDVSVPEHIETDTGLIDIRGEAIVRFPRPIGFGRDHEW